MARIASGQSVDGVLGDVKGSMRKRVLKRVCSCVLVACGFIVLVSGRDENSSLISEEHAVYRTLLESVYISGPIKLLTKNKIEMFVLFPWGGVGLSTDLIERVRKKIRPELRQTLDELIGDCGRKADFPHILNDQLKLNVKWILFDKQAQESVFAGPGPDANWKRFYTRYPNSSGHIGLSRVGFNKAQTLAIVNVHHGYASWGMSQSLYFFKKEKGKWAITEVYHYAAA